MPAKTKSAAATTPKPKKVTDQKVSGELSETELQQISGGIEQTIGIGSASSGAGAGKVTFNPF